MSDTTLRTRRDEWIAAGVFDQLCREALAAFDKIIGLDLTEVAIDGSQHKAPYGGEGTGQARRPGQTRLEVVDRRRPPRRADRLGARRREPQRRQAPRTHTRRDRSTRTTRRCRHDAPRSRLRLQQDPARSSNATGLDVDIQRRRKPGDGKRKKLISLGLRWIVEATNSWLSNFGQLRRNTDRRTHHRHAALCFATTILITMKLIVWRDRYCTT